MWYSKLNPTVILTLAVTCTIAPMVAEALAPSDKLLPPSQHLRTRNSVQYSIEDVLAILRPLYDVYGKGPDFTYKMYAPSELWKVGEIFQEIRLGPGKKFVDLGSGDGRVVVFAALIGAEATGFEIVPQYFESAVRITEDILGELRKKGYPFFEKREIQDGFEWARSDRGAGSIRLIRKDFMEESISFSSFDVVFRYGSGQGMEESMLTMLERDLKSGAYVIQYSVPLDIRLGAPFVYQPWEWQSAWLQIYQIWEMEWLQNYKIQKREGVMDRGLCNSSI